MRFRPSGRPPSTQTRTRFSPEGRRDRIRLSATRPSRQWSRPGACHTVTHENAARTPMKFRGELQLSGKTATGIEVPEDIVTRLGGGKRPAVRVTLGGYTYRTTIAPMGGSYWIGVS